MWGSGAEEGLENEKMWRPKKRGNEGKKMEARVHDWERRGHCRIIHKTATHLIPYSHTALFKVESMRTSFVPISYKRPKVREERRERERKKERKKGKKRDKKKGTVVDETKLLSKKWERDDVCV